MVSKTPLARKRPPEVSFPELLRFLAHLADDQQKDGELPDRVDRAWWERHGYTELSVRSRLRSAVEFLGLTTGPEHTPTPVVNDLIGRDLSELRATLRRLLEMHYAPILGTVSKPDATRHDLESAFMQIWGLNERTAGKALPFFLAAAAYTELPMSPNLGARSAPPMELLSRIGSPPVILVTPMTQNGRHADRPTVASSPSQESAVLPSHHAEPLQSTQPAGVQTRTVTLPGAGSVSLSVSVDVFALNEAQRKWVFDLIDRVRNPSREVLAEDQPPEERGQNHV